MAGGTVRPEIIWAGPLDYYGVEAAIDHATRRLAEQGRTPYAIPIGGASLTGALGYVRAAQELTQQHPDTDMVVVAEAAPPYPSLVDRLDDHFAKAPRFGEAGASLLDLLRAPALAAPTSLAR